MRSVLKDSPWYKRLLGAEDVKDHAKLALLMITLFALLASQEVSYPKAPAQGATIAVFSVKLLQQLALFVDLEKF